MKKGEQQANIRKTVAIVSLVSVFIKLIGFFREFALSRAYSPDNPVSDAYIIATRIPITIFAFVATAIGTTYIIIYTKLAQSDKKRSQEFSDSIITIFLIIATVTTVLLCVFSKYVVTAFAPKSAKEVKVIATQILRISAPSLMVMVFISACTSFLEYKNKFVICSLASLPRNMMLIASMFLSIKTGSWMLGFGILSAYILEILFFLPSLHKSKFKYRIKIKRKNPDVREALLISLPLLLSAGVGKINIIVDQQVSSYLHSTGAISLLNYGHVLHVGILQIFLTGFISVFFANITKLIAAKAEDKVNSMVCEAVSIMNFLLIPAFIGLALYSEDIARLVFNSGKTPKVNFVDSQTIGKILFAYSPILYFQGINDLQIKILYGYKKVVWPTVFSVFSIGLNVGANFLFNKWFGLVGIAFATSVCLILSVIIFQILISNTLGIDLYSRKHIGDFAKICVATCAMAIWILITKNTIFHYMRYSLALILGIITSMLVFGVSVVVLKIKEVDYIINVINKKLISKLRKR